MLDITHMVAPHAFGYTPEAIEDLAEDRRMHFSYTVGDSMITLLERLGGRFFDQRVPVGYDMVAWSASNFSIALGHTYRAGYLQFLAAQQLGHLVMHLPEALNRGACMIVPSVCVPPAAVYIEACQFAFSFLMPRAMLRQDENRMSIEAIAEKYGVSLRIARLRCGLRCPTP